MRYHTEILRLLGVEPRVSPDAVRMIEAREAACGVRFPASVREWLSLERAHELFEENTTPDYLVPLEKLGDPAEVAQGWLQVAVENQAVVRWYVKLDGKDNGPVFHDNDEWNEDLAKIPWELQASSFQTFLFDSMAGHRWRCWYTGLRLRGESSPPTGAILGELRARFDEGPRTDEPDLNVFRFFTPSSLLRIRVEEGRATWTFQAASADDLARLVEPVWSVGDLARTLEAEACDRNVAASGRAVLARLRR